LIAMAGFLKTLLRNHMAKVKLNAGHWHEATDRTYCIMQMIDSMLYEHLAISQTPELKQKIEKAQELLGKVYQEAGVQLSMS
jgi:hypothetical protein